MTDPNSNPLYEDKNEHKNTSYEPASFEKRTAAWMGIAYMVMLLFVITYAIFTGGNNLPGTFPLFLVPACVAVMVIIIYHLRNNAAIGGILVSIIMIILCIIGIIFGLTLGIPALAAAMQSPYG